MRALITRIAALALVALIAAVARGDNRAVPWLWPVNELEFARLVYDDGGRGWPGGSWAVDYDDAERYFEEGVSRLSRIDMGGSGVLIQLDDDALFDYPWLYAVEVGYWRLSEQEAEQLREYLLRGGFLMVDDFHGTVQWRGFMEGMRRVFPNRPVVDIEDSHEILHVVYDVDERIQVPGIRAIEMGQTHEDDGYEPVWKGIYDDHGRLMVMINHNMDLGDAWELADAPYYPQEMTKLALQFAVNYAVYAMTH